MLSLAARRLLAASLSASRQRRLPTALPSAPSAALEPLPNLDRLSIKSMGKKSHYAVVRGRVPGIYLSWNDCEAQVQGFKDNLYKGFSSELDAAQYLEQHGVALGVHSQASEPVLLRNNMQAATALEEKRRQTINKNIHKNVAIPSENNTASATVTYANTEKSLQEEEEEKEREAEEKAANHLHSIERPSTTATTFGRTTLLKTLVPPGSTARMQFDGASKRNPGPAALGAVLYDAETGLEVGTVKAYMGDYFTNNQAEYAGLIAGLQAAYDMGYDGIEVQGDSKLIVNQVLGIWKVKNEGLMPYHQLAVALKRKFKIFKAKQVPRAENFVADALGNEAIREWNQGVGGEIWTLEGAKAAAEAAAEGDKTSQRPLKKQKL